MRTFITNTLVGLTVLIAAGSAHAAEDTSTATNRALHLSIALQGDQALVDIRSSVVAALPQLMREQMETALPRFVVANGTTPFSAGALDADTLATGVAY